MSVTTDFKIKIIDFSCKIKIIFFRLCNQNCMAQGEDITTPPKSSVVCSNFVSLYLYDTWTLNHLSTTPLTVFDEGKRIYYDNCYKSKLNSLKRIL